MHTLRLTITLPFVSTGRPYQPRQRRAPTSPPRAPGAHTGAPGHLSFPADHA